MPLPGHEGGKAPSPAVRDTAAKPMLSKQTPEQTPTDLLLMGQDNGQGAGQMPGEAPSLSVEGVNALGVELCSKVGTIVLEG